MIIIFHCLSIIIFQLLRNRKRIKFWQRTQENRLLLEEIYSSKNVDIEYNLKFEPPVFRQRYGSVYETLLDERWRKEIKKLVDFGCAEFGIFIFLKRLRCLNDITFVDIDENTLKEHTWKLQPLTIDYLKRRDEPLNITVMAGSVADPDYRLLKTDAVTAIELIEHLYPDVLDAFPYNVFSFIEPKIVIVTTPNSDFNVLFSSNVNRFRHDDHKFEWSREQFQDWATNVTVRFPDYTVTFSGIGEGPEGTEDLGRCSQMAVFIRKDMLDDKYLSKIYGAPCLCSGDSPCKGLTAQSKLLCNCVCALCSPSASTGICTYCSYSKQIVSYEIEDDGEQIVSYNIYYKFIESVQYPFEYDHRTEEERMMDDFRYRINTFGQAWGRFYVEERSRSEIPLRDLVYGPEGCFITEPELHKLLTKNGYQIEECRIQETGLFEKCVIYIPLMGEISSTSEASGYDSDFTKYHLNEESLSDWDEPCVTQENNKPPGSHKNTKDINCMEMTSHDSQLEATTDIEEDKKQQDSLFDSGYQKSLSLVDDSPQTPLEDLEETDVFEETTSTPSLSSEDNKVHLKRASTLEKANFVPQQPDMNKLKLDTNRINELDKYHNISSGRTFLSHPPPPPLPEFYRKNFLRDRDSLPGPSNGSSRKRKKFKKSASADGEDDSPLADVKSIANCILENTLNKIEVNEEKDELIQYVPPEPEVAPPVQANEAPQEPVLVVENGDLANNNRDVEGNNYIAQDQADDNIGNDIANDNVEIIAEQPRVQEENANFDNNNQQAEADIIEDPPVIIAEPVNVENAENVQQPKELPAESLQQAASVQQAENVQQVETAVAQASREVLFDPNSEQDLLADFEIPAPLHEAPPDVHDVDEGNIRLIGVRLAATPENFGADYSADDVFPNWLLQILGTQGVMEEVPPPGSEEDSHFYCQGDGLGVHPSVIAVEIDEEDETNETTESSNNTADFADVEQGPSSNDMSSLPEDSQANIQETQGLLEPENESVRPTASEHNLDPNPDSDVGTNESK